eukprot:330044-Hanusia_phi.AAC.6
MVLGAGRGEEEKARSLSLPQRRLDFTGRISFPTLGVKSQFRLDGLDALQVWMQTLLSLKGGKAAKALEVARRILRDMSYDGEKGPVAAGVEQEGSER